MFGWLRKRKAPRPGLYEIPGRCRGGKWLVRVDEDGFGWPLCQDSKRTPYKEAPAQFYRDFEQWKKEAA